MVKNCKQCGSDFKIPDEDLTFLKKFHIDHPQLCPDCRRERRLAHWPFGVLQKRKCDLSGETIISAHSQEAHFPVYKRKYWFEGDWDVPEMEIDWDRSFMDQLYELQCQTPHFHQVGKQNENCDYADDVWECKNCYMSRSLAGNEDIYYSYRILFSHNSFDLTYCYNMEQCYECTYCFRCFNLKFSLNCNECRDSWFLYDCRGCNDCFLCWNLRNKKYCILNEQYSKEDYEEKLAGFELNSRASLNSWKDSFAEHLENNALHRATINVNVQDCEGNYITDCKNCSESYFLEDSEDCKYEMRSPSTKDSFDTCGLFRGELGYEICQCTDCNNVCFGLFSVDCNFCFYIDQCYNSHDLFGCVGLRRKSYCILNKQYSQEEYEELVPRLIQKMRADDEWGEFFPYKFAYNGFNLSLASFYHSETESSVLEKGSYIEALPDVDSSGLLAESLSDSSSGILDSIIGKPFICSATGRTYGFVKQELDFYRRHALPLPVFYPEYRNKLRFDRLMSLSSREVNCDLCGEGCVTYHSQEFGYKIVACEKCYLKEVY